MRPNANGCSHSTNTSARCVRAAVCPSAYATTSWPPTKYASEVGVCQIDLMRRIGLEEYRKDHSAESATKLDSLTVGINPR